MIDSWRYLRVSPYLWVHRIRQSVTLGGLGLVTSLAVGSSLANREFRPSRLSGADYRLLNEPFLKD